MIDRQFIQNWRRWKTVWFHVQVFMPPQLLAGSILEKDVNSNRNNLLRCHEREAISQREKSLALVHRLDEQRDTRANWETDGIGYHIVNELK